MLNNLSGGGTVRQYIRYIIQADIKNNSLLDTYSFICPI